jgi:uncharacterized protein YdhG (YjbR/CyaY superfamily)
VKKHRATTIDAYLAQVTPSHRAALERLRRAIKAAAPDAVECISYQIPAFRLGGRVFVWFGAATNHYALYPGARPIELHAKELSGYNTSKGTVRFPLDAALPKELVRKLVQARIAEHGEAGPRTTKRGAGAKKGSGRKTGGRKIVDRKRGGRKRARSGARTRSS